MTLDHWLAFAAASAVLLVIPGPTILLVISYALGHGRRLAGPTVAGVALGDFTSMTASMLGLGVLLAASAGLFTALKLVGAAYLVFLGVRLWRAAPVGDANSTMAPAGAAADASMGRSGKPSRAFLHAYAVTALNPKGIVFFVAFLPQFLDTARPLLPQLVVFEATFLTLATANATAYALLATAARRAVRTPSVQRAVNRTGGALLIAMGALAATWRRAPG